MKSTERRECQTARVCKAVVPHTVNSGQGKIINMASIAGLRPPPGMGAYSISKNFRLMLTQVLALELGQNNTQVAATAHGVIKTRISRVYGRCLNSPSPSRTACL